MRPRVEHFRAHVRLNGLTLSHAYAGPDIEDADDDLPRRLSPLTMRVIVLNTTDQIRQQNYPRVFLGDHPENDDAPDCGLLVAVHEAKIQGVAGIVGDLLIDRATFDRHVRSDEYPHRSIGWGSYEGPIDHVALLHRSHEPRRPLLQPTTFSLRRRVCAWWQPPARAAIQTRGAGLSSSLGLRRQSSGGVGFFPSMR